MSIQAFIDLVAKIAIKLRLEGSCIFPSLRIAQAGLETGWKVNSWNNLVGFKVGSRPPNGYWKGACVNKGTWEVYDGVRTDIVAAFRAYDTIEDCFRDQDELFKLFRYDRVRAAKTTEQQADMLYACGYATDPQYAQKLKNIIFMYDLRRFDLKAEGDAKLMDELRKENESLKRRLDTQGRVLDDVQLRLKALERHKSMDVPGWAQEAIDAAVKAGLVDTPQGGSFDFYRMITVLHRAGLLTNNSNCGIK